MATPAPVAEMMPEKLLNLVLLDVQAQRYAIYARAKGLSVIQMMLTDIALSEPDYSTLEGHWSWNFHDWSETRRDEYHEVDQDQPFNDWLATRYPER